MLVVAKVLVVGGVLVVVENVTVDVVGVVEERVDVVGNVLMVLVVALINITSISSFNTINQLINEESKYCHSANCVGVEVLESSSVRALTILNIFQ